MTDQIKNYSVFCLILIDIKMKLCERFIKLLQHILVNLGSDNGRERSNDIYRKMNERLH